MADAPNLAGTSPASVRRIPSGWRRRRQPTAASRSCAPSTQAGAARFGRRIGEPIVNVSSRYSSVDWNGQRMMGLNNIELISDRPIEVNLREIAEVKKRYPKHAVIASLMVESKRETWHDHRRAAEDAGADGLELNFGCPHGMSERGMGSAVGQVPEYAQMITDVGEGEGAHAGLVKLTPNITDIRVVARAAKRGGADGLWAINTINSITGIDLDTLHAASERRRQKLARRLLRTGGKADCAEHGSAGGERRGNSGPAHLRHRRHRNWRDAAEFILLGCGTVQVCTAAMHYGYRIVEDMIDGLSNWMDEKGLRHHRGFSRPEPDQNHGVEAPEPELQDRRTDRRGAVHRLRALPHRVLGWRAPVHSPGPRDRPGGWACRTARETARSKRRPSRSQSRRFRSSIAPGAHVGPYRDAAWSGFRGWTRPNASAAICARWFARSITASPWSKSRRAASPRPGQNGRPAGRQRSDRHALTQH